MKTTALPNDTHTGLRLARVLFLALFLLPLFHGPSFSEGLFLNSDGRGQAKDQTPFFFGFGERKSEGDSSATTRSYSLRETRNAYNPYNKEINALEASIADVSKSTRTISNEEALRKQARLASQRAQNVVDSALAKSRADLDRELQKSMAQNERNRAQREASKNEKRKTNRNTANTAKTRQEYVHTKITPYAPKRTFAERDETENKTQTQDTKKTNRLFLTY